jgi:CHAD domain-containing protein
MAPFPYSFARGGKPADEFVAVLRRLSTRLRTLSREPDRESLHETRTSIKLLLALLWLMKPSLPPEVTATTHEELKKAARLLAGARDARVMKSTLEKLKKDARQHERAAIDEIGSRLEEKKARDMRPKLRHSISIVRETIALLERNAAAKSAPVEKRLKKAFRQTAKAEKQARRRQTPPGYHAWRKKAKRLLYLLQVLEPDPKRKKAHQIKGIDRLQHHLGDHHDSVVLEQKLREHLASSHPIFGLLRKRRHLLRKKAEKVARRLK